MALATDGNGQQYVLILSGGANVQSNNVRYLENVRAMYSAARSMNVDSSQIVVLYGSGNLKDTTTVSPQFGAPSTPYAPSGPYGVPSGHYGYGGYLPMQGSLGQYPADPSAVDPSNPNQAAPSVGIQPGMKISRIPTPSKTVPDYGGFPTSPPPSGVPDGVDGNEDTPHRLTEDYVFNGEKRKLNGGASLENIKAQFYDLKTKMKPGDQLLVFVTDHGSLADSGESEVVLWNGETLSASDFGDLLRDLPPGTKVKVVTNICYGGGLTSMTSNNVCVMANQKANKVSNSQDVNLDRFGQAFPYAIKKRIASEPGKKSNLRDAFDYATALDNPANEPQTSLDYFLEKNREAILAAAKAKVTLPDFRENFCKDNGVGKDLRTIVSLMQEFDQIEQKLDLSLTGIPADRLDLVKGRLESAVNTGSVGFPRKLQLLSIQVDDLKASLIELNKSWGSMTDEEKQNARERMNFQTGIIRDQLAGTTADQKRLAQIALEVKLLKYGDPGLVQQYRDVRKCLEYEY